MQFCISLYGKREDIVEENLISLKKTVACDPYMRDLIEEQNREYEEALREEQERDARETEEEKLRREEEMNKAEKEEEEVDVVLSPNALRRVRMEYFVQKAKRRRRRSREAMDVSNILPVRLRSGSLHGRR